MTASPSLSIPWAHLRRDRLGAGGRRVWPRPHQRRDPAVRAARRLVGLLCVLGTLGSPACWLRMPGDRGAGWVACEGRRRCRRNLHRSRRLADDGTSKSASVTTPEDPAVGLFHALDPLKPPHAVELLVHGTTIATNALLERRGARIALVTTKGFEDLLWLRRQDRAALYDLARDHPPRWSRGRTSWGSPSGPAPRECSSRSARTRSSGWWPRCVRWFPSRCAGRRLAVRLPPRGARAPPGRGVARGAPNVPIAASHEVLPGSGSSSARAPPPSRRTSVPRSPPISDGSSATLRARGIGMLRS